MRLTLDHDRGVDVGQLHIGLGPDDPASMTCNDGVSTIHVSFYAREAAQLIELLTPLAETH